jgi:outer membrane protein TolC
LADRTRAKEWWLPDIYVGASTHYLAGAAMNTDGKILTNLTRNNLWTGLGVAAEIDFNRGKYRLLAAKQQAASLQYQSAAERNKAILSAVQAYFDLQVDQLKYLFLQTLADQADTLSRQIKVKVDAGLLYQSDYLLSQSNYNHLEISMMQAKTEWQKKSALLSNLLNLGNNIHLISADTSLIPLTLVAPPADSSGFEKRPEYLELGAELQSLQTLRKTTKEGLFLPKFRIGMDNGAFGAYTGPVQNTYQVNAAILWTIPIGRLAYKGDLKQWNAKIALQRNKEEQFKNQFRQEVSSATAELQTANEQIRIARLALASSSGALRQGIDREKLGTAKAFEVFQAQQLFLQAQMDYLQAVSEYNKAQYALKVAIGEML